MADRAETRLSIAEGRRFALTLAGGFALLAIVSRVRGRETAAFALGGVAVVCLLAGIVVPQGLSGPRRAWMRFGDLIGAVMRPIVLSVIYGVVMTPAGMLRRRLSRSPLARNREAPTYWFPVSSIPADDARRGMEHMF